MNSPNKITIFRIFLVPVCMIFVIPIPDWIAENDLDYLNDFIFQYGNYVAGIVLVIGACLNGYIARNRNLITKFGKFIDQIADKILISVLLISLVGRNEVSGWAAIIIISREFLVTGLMIIKAREGNIIETGRLCKVKTVLQIVAISLSLFSNFPFSMYTQIEIDKIIMIIAVVVTVYSGCDYFMKNREGVLNDV